MADWHWHDGPVEGRCAGCDEVLMPAAMIVDWRGRAYHVDCVLDALSRLVAAHTPIFPYP